MPADIFDFWSQMDSKDKWHPQDREVLARFGGGDFEPDCWPSPFIGPLRTAPVVLLYLSAGFEEFDKSFAKEPTSCDKVRKQLTGTQPLPSESDHKSAWEWWVQRTKCFGAWQSLQEKVAILDICGYHSSTFIDHHLLAALPSCRASLDWAQRVLFPEAILGKRVVVCLRSPRYWGLDAGKEGTKYPQSLFAPAVNRSGHMQRIPLRAVVIDEVKKIIGCPRP
jgi:hypothetical protein